jgi:AI-2 transport protein TqsA
VIVATLLPLSVVLVRLEVSVTAAVLAIAVPAVIQFVLGKIVEPRIMGGSLDLHPVVILPALM